jgi:hypothetical protein
MMPEAPLPIVDARGLDEERRTLLRPGELVRDECGRARRLPCFFFEVPSWQAARETELAPNFGLWEFIETDLHEPPILRAYPRYVPCAVLHLASLLSFVRAQLGQPVWIGANGGYRSPSHRRSRPASTHAWGTAVNIYRVGDEWLDNQAAIERVAAVATRAVRSFWARPYGSAAGCNDDHLHLDLGFTVVIPRDSPGE